MPAVIRTSAALAATLLLGALALAACDGGSGHAASLPSTGATGATTTVGADCTPARPAPAAREQTFRFGGVDRHYLLEAPAVYDGRRALPLVLDFPGFANTMEAQDAFTEMGTRGTTHGFVVVTPDALGSPRQWNEFALPGQADDFGFVHALVADLERRLCVDRERVYGAGHSNGSAFAAFLACRAPYDFAAVAMVSATTPAGCPDGVAPSVLAIAGTADLSVPYTGGTVAGSTIPIPAARATIAAYAERYHCAEPARVATLRTGVSELRYTGCTGGAEVALDTVADGSHTWPGGPAAAVDATDSAAGKGFAATERILTFFAAHHRTPSP